MTVRRGVPLVACLLATVAVAVAQPKKKGAPAPKPVPAKEPAPAPAPAAGSGSAAEPPPPPPEERPGDMEGKDENPNAPKSVVTDEPVAAPVVVVAPKRTGYPTEEVLRPITLPRNMAEVAIVPRAAVDLDEVGYAGSATLYARYGITSRAQIGLNYVLGGVYDDPKTAEDKVKFKPGKAIELAFTYKIREFIGARLGVPVWIYKPSEESDSSAPGIGITVGVPLKFVLTPKFAVGGLDDFLAFKVTQFAPSMEYEYLNAGRAAARDTNTSTSAGYIRFGAYGVYQQSPQLALIGRFGVTLEDFSTTRSEGSDGGVVTHLRAGLEYTVKSYLDLGISLGFDDLDDLGSFGPTGLLAFRI